MTEADDIPVAFVADMQWQIAGQLCKIGLDQKQAEAVAERVIDAVRESWGGERQYIAVPDKRKRNKQIIEEWKRQRAEGRENRNGIAAKFSIHRRTVDRVITRYLARRTSGQGFGRSDWNL